MQEVFNKGNLELFVTIIYTEHSGIREKQILQTYTPARWLD